MSNCRTYSPRLAFIGCFIVILLASASLGYALEIHHVFADVDHDGHQHSDFDLCQWVQSHAANSLVGGGPPWRRDRALLGLLTFLQEYQVFSPVSSPYGSRGPPVFSSL
ncbi:MAG: hypothetical protein KC587_18420 [Nitrospira sp.]|nr:hypothetical protein [Nitrospira sp.]